MNFQRLAILSLRLESKDDSLRTLHCILQVSFTAFFVHNRNNSFKESEQGSDATQQSCDEQVSWFLLRDLVQKEMHQTLLPYKISTLLYVDVSLMQ